MKKVDFIYFDAGGGHRAAATALRQVMEQQQRPVEIRMVNLQEMLDSMDVFRKVTGVRLQDLYNLMLKKGWTLGSAQLLAGMHAVIRLFQGQQVRMLRDFWHEDPPDLVVSLVPNFGRAIYLGLRSESRAPLVTVITDFADYPPHFWMERQDQYYVCGTQKAVEQAWAIGHPDSRIFRTSGMILNPRFYEMTRLSAEERARERRKLGLDPDMPIGLVLFGGQGAAVMESIARDMPQRQLISICGHNEKLRQRMSQMERKAAMHVEGFTKEVPRFMQIVDYFIGKPGPGSISEAIAMHLPIIVEKNAWTLPQERYNADWVVEQGVGIVVPNFRRIAAAVDELLDAENYARFREATEKQQNRALFEVVDIVMQLLG